MRPLPSAGSAKKYPRGSEESNRKRPVIETGVVGGGVMVGAIVAAAPAFTHPRSTQNLSLLGVVNNVRTSKP